MAHPQVPRDGSGKSNKGNRCWTVLSVAPTTVSRHWGHLERFFRWFRRRGTRTGSGRPLAALLFFWPEFGRATCDSWEELQTTPSHDVAGHGSIYVMVSVSGYLRPSEGPTPQEYQPVAGVSEFWSFLLHFEEEPQRSNTGTHDDSILLDSPYLVELDWTGAEGPHRGTPVRSPLQVQLLRLSGTVSAISRKRLGRCWCRIRCVDPPEQQIPKPPRSSETWKVAATSVHGMLRKHARLQASASRYSPRLIAFLTVCTRPLLGRHLELRQDRPLPPIRMKGPFVVQLFSGGNGVGRACRSMGFAARSW